VRLPEPRTKFQYMIVSVRAVVPPRRFQKCSAPEASDETYDVCVGRFMEKWVFEVC
jgi:hypothetical protein